MRKRLPLLLAVALGAVLIGGIIFLVGSKADSKPAAEDVPSALVSPAQRGDITHVLGLAGQFQPYQMVDIHPKVSGFIRAIYVDIGDKVHKGQTLAILEVPELQAQLAGAVAQVGRTQDEIVRAQHEVTRAESEDAAVHANNIRLQATAKAQPGLVAQQELDDAQAKDLSAAAQVDAAKAALSAAKQGAQVAVADHERVSAIQGYTNVVAPLDGVVVWRYADTGALIQSGTESNNQALPIIKLSQSSLLRLRLPVPEDAVKYVKAGDQMRVRVDALGRSFTGAVVRFTRDLSFETRTMETEIDVENKNLSIDPGMYADVQFPFASVTNVITVPVESVVLQGNQHYVYLVDNKDHVRLRPVQVGLQGSTLAEIKSGLEVGDRVMLGGQQRYHDGEAVKPLLQARPASDTTLEPNSTIDTNDEQGGQQ